MTHIEAAGTNQPTSQEWFDGTIKKILMRHKNRNDVWVNNETVYNAKQQVIKTSLPYFDNNPQQWTTFQYDDYGRVISRNSPTFSLTTSYSGRTISSTNTSTTPNQTTSRTTDVIGLTTSATDDGGTINYSYDSYGNVIEIIGPASTTTLKYDPAGFQDELIDPAAGTITYDFNALGELTQQVDALNQSFNMTYDKLGRVLTTTGPDGTYTNTYDASFRGSIDNATSPYGPSITYRYDNLGRLTNLTETVEGQDYEFTYSYNSKGNLSEMTYPNQLTIERLYDPYGFVSTIRNASNPQEVIWEFVDENEFGQITEYQLGQTTVNKNFDPLSAMPTQHFAEGIEYEYTFDYATGNLLERNDMTTGNLEIFEYDDLNRLKSHSSGSGSTLTMEYSNTGDINEKSDVGEYTNDDGGGRTLSIVNNPNTISDDPQTITYTPFNSVATIMEGAFDASFLYGPDDQRRKMTINEHGNVYKERYYLGGGIYEKEEQDGLRRNFAYINTPSGQEAVYITEEGGHEYVLHLLNRDYLGSILNITDGEGAILEEYSYDPWGNRRDPQTQVNNYNPGQNQNLFSGIIHRGYTGHEHLDCFGLINMNGRVYDPLVARMLSPDNFVQNPEHSQGLNRYTYAFNNPLKFTDPDGEIAFMAVVGIYAGVNLAADLIRNDFKMNIGEIGVSVGLGAVQGALAATGVGAAATGWTVLGSALASQINIPIIQTSSYSLSVSPSLYAGTNGVRVGASILGSTSIGNTSVGFGYNIGRNFGATDLSGQLSEAKWSSITSWNLGWSNGPQGFSYGQSYYGGNYSQSVGRVGFQIGRFSAGIENDFLTGSGDKYRSAAITTSYQVNDDLSLIAGFSIWTGAPNEKSSYTVNGVNRPCYYSDCENPSAIRNGNFFAGANYRGGTYLAGGNSEVVRSAIQNGWHDAMGSKALKWMFGGPSPHFEKMNYQSRFYSSYGTYNPFTIYRQ